MSEIDLWKKQLGEIPDFVWEQRSVERLILVTDNALTSLPDCIGSLTQLRELHLRNNHLQTLPDAIGQLRSLRVLDLRGNPLSALPSSLFVLPMLDKLDLRWTPRLEIEEEVGRLEGRGALVYR